MSKKQLSVLLENKKGALADVTGCLENAGINLLSLSLADTNDYGIARIMTDDSLKASEILRASGHTVSVKEVCAVKVPDKAGGLANVLNILDEHDINIEYIYASAIKNTEGTVIIMRTDDTKAAEALLSENGVEAL